jgi:linoleoyl-CoA desaturase
MLLAYFVPLSIVSFSGLSSSIVVYMLFIISGFGMAGIGMGIMHDALHGTYSANKMVNRIMGYTMNIIGASDTVWKLQHNVLHHSFTNIEHHDDDINAPFFLRFSPHSKKNKLHKYQHLYVWLFYGLSTMSWVTAKDFIRLTRYRKMGLIKSSREFNNALMKIIVWKLFYYCYMLLLPLILSPVASVHIILAFLSMHFVTGLTIS